MSGHDIAVSLMLLVADVTVVTAVACIQTVILAVAGVLEVPDGFLLLVSLLLLTFLV